MRELRDPKALRAIAHPVRVRLLDELAAGPATATELAERIGESPANCSWHLRQLAKYEFVEEAGGGTGRKRPWQIIMRGHIWGVGDEDPELAVASDALTQLLFERESGILQTWLRARRTEQERPWRDAHFLNQGASWLTAQEVTELGEAIQGLILRYVGRLTDPESRPPGARLVRFVSWGVPDITVPPIPDES
jgi:DNA-binding transcriptional ArsR family regulator